MPKVNQPDPDPNRRQTRATNANAHPGNVVKEVLGSRRKQEEIDNEKKAREERREAKEQRKAEKKKTIHRIADFENTMALQDKIEEASFPRHQLEVKAPTKPRGTSRKRKGISSSKRDSQVVGHTGSQKNNFIPLPNPPELDVRTSDDDKHSTSRKKQKTATGYLAVALRRTETYLRSDDLDQQTQTTVPIELEDTDIEDNTPKPKKQGKLAMQFRTEDGNSQIESEEDFYATPKMLQKKDHDTNSDPDVSNDNTDSLDQAGWHNKNELDDESTHKSVRHQNSKHRATGGKPKTIDLTQMQKPRGKNTKRAFRKEVEEHRAAVAKGGGKKDAAGTIPARNNGSGNHRKSSEHATGNPASSGDSKVTTLRHDNSNQKIVSTGKLDSHRASSGRHVIHSQLDINSRDSATAGNGIGIIQNTHTDGKALARKPKQNSVTVVETTVVNLSDEDDSAERESILQSPPKGMHRLSSRAIVKVE